MAALAAGFLIRTPRTEDVPVIARLEAEVFADPWPGHLYLQEIGQPLRFQRVVVDANSFLAAYLFACWQADELHVLKVATHPLHQGKGLATSLLEDARLHAVHGNARGLVLEVRPSNRRAVTLYRYLGYTVLGRRPHYYSDGEDALVMFYDIHNHP
jgi:[ribosomal protein S18]-alanine N-acetyltransferase